MSESEFWRSAARVARARSGPGAVPVRTAGPPTASSSQQGFYFLSQVAPDDPVYNCGVCLSLDGPVDVAALARAVQGTAGRHDALRARFEPRQGVPAPVLEPGPAIRLGRADVGRAELYERVRQEFRAPFDLHRGPLCRFTLFTHGPDRHVLSCVLHHTVGDGWSHRVILSELGARYRAIVAGGEQPRPSPGALTYWDFTRWQNGRDHAAGLAFWTNHLRDLEQAEDLLPGARPAASASSESHTTMAALPARLVSDLTEIGRARGAGLHAVGLAALLVLFARCTGRTDVVVATPYLNRELPEVHDIVGLFAAQLPFRLRLGRGEPFTSVVARVRATTFDAYEHALVPLGALVRAVAPVRRTAAQPFSRTHFALEDETTLTLSLPGVRTSRFWVDRGAVIGDLAFVLRRMTTREMRAVAYWRADRYPDQVAERLFHAYVELLASLAADPAQPVHPAAPVRKRAREVPSASRPAPAPDSGSGATSARGERQIAALWRELLPDADPGPEDDFYALGGHSLLLIRLARLISQRTGRQISVTALAPARTVRQQARVLHAAEAAEGARS
ncbi:condensation domain-containing protein [Nonomuraea sp. MG754425]|uniref:condensation domain-containing protein n=1 Tax=Nonomuraea sp. MG754425 TaxID=2570319 RepID=UPI001F174A97|nr:condensation domain-containing protein [Nonomuraea sp. MG754425]